MYKGYLSCFLLHLKEIMADHGRSIENKSKIINSVKPDKSTIHCVWENMTRKRGIFEMH